MDNNSPDIIVLKFADSKVPVFKEARNRDYIKYGDENKYPEYLTYLFNKSAKHNAIITGKANYIFGEGFENGNAVVNRLGESLNDIARKAILDIEIYGGFRLEVIWNRIGKISEIYHVDYSSIRIGKNGGFYYKESWENLREEEIFINAFDPSNPVGTQIYAYNEYRPMTRFYPLPSYIGCNNYVETDIEISKYYLSAIRNGMMPSKMLQFYMGDPGEEKKKELEGRFKNKFGGSENAGKFVMVFNPGGKDKTIEVTDLSGSEMDKMFTELNKTCQQEIFSGHLVTSPMLFGIKTEGQLGGSTELKTAYDIFINTYAKPKANSFEKEIIYLLSYSSFAGQYQLRQTDPIGWEIPESILSQAITPDDVRQKLGLPVAEKAEDSAQQKTLNAIAGVGPLVANKILDSLTKNEIRALAALPPTADGNVILNPDGSTPEPVVAPTLDSDVMPANDNIKNLSAKQHQQLMRIIRQYSKGQLTELAAKALLRTGLGLNDQDINNILGIEAAMSSEEPDIIGMFDECGESKNDYEILKSKKVSFSIEEAAEDEEVFIESFKTIDISVTENKILELIKKDNKITPQVISQAIGETEAFVKSKIDNLVKRGYLETKTITVGADEIIERVLSKRIELPPIKTGARIAIKYSYEVKPGVGPELIPTSRPFCRKMIELNRLYSRADIERISMRLGYSVFDRKGGFWGKSPECRHRWESNIVIKK